MDATDSPALPALELAQRQCEWLRGARTRMLRNADISRRKHVLDLGAGWGCVTKELAERTDGQVTAIDHHPAALEHLRKNVPQVQTIDCDAGDLKLPDDSVDLVFTQCALLWFADAAKVVSEIRRVLMPGGVAVCIEPDFGGLMESPPESAMRDVWCSALSRAGANPLIGRELPEQFGKVNMETSVWQLDRVHAFDLGVWDFLEELWLNPEEQERLETARSVASSKPTTVHLPFWWLHAEK